MKTKYLLLLFCLAGALLSSCKDDGLNPGYDDVPERMRMTMFAWRDVGFGEAQTIAQSEPEEDVLAGKVSGPLRPNRASLIWYAVDGAAGYHIRVRNAAQGGNLGGADVWTPENVTRDIIITDPTQTQLILEGLQYGAAYNFAIRVLSPKGVMPTEATFYDPTYLEDPYHSLWYGYGDATDRPHNFGLQMYQRDGVPEVIAYEDRTETTVRITFTLNWNDLVGKFPEYGAVDYILNAFIDDQFEPDPNATGNRFKMDYITLEPVNKTTSDGTPIPSKRIDLTEDDKINGFVLFEGLTPNVQYIINGVNEAAANQPGASVYDTYYNTDMVRMRGGVPPVIDVPHIRYTALPLVQGVDETADAFARRQANETELVKFCEIHDASRIDTILRNYMTDTDLAEGTSYRLEPGKTYYMHSGVDLSKGLKVYCEDPTNPAKILMGGMWATGSGTQIAVFDYDKVAVDGVGAMRANNFSFGRVAAEGEMGSVVLEDIIFENLDFDVPDVYNYDNRAKIKGNEAGSGQGNYFVNQNANVMTFRCESVQMRNCTFQGFVRGFIRVQGQKGYKVVNRFEIDNCLFYNCGGHDSSAAGYGFLDTEDRMTRTNILKNVSITNSTFAGASYVALIRNRQNEAWAPGLTWSVNISNCTFLNWGMKHGDRTLIWLQYPPTGGFQFTAKKNLFIVRSAREESMASYNCSALRVDRFDGVRFDISDNYSTNLYPGTAMGIFSKWPFNGTSNGAGVQSGTLNVGGTAAAGINEGFPSLSPEQLMNDPYPLGNMNTVNGMKHNVPEGLYYNDTPQVRSHDIVRLGIGAPRWASRLN